ncbi:hypothetical protein LB505_008655 [Fusarium chuoi]|nr:hypothetical protein LB505_008655 [Fusarium chuoi]
MLKDKTEVPEYKGQKSCIQLWIPDRPNYVQAQAPEARSNTSQPRGSIDSSSTGPSEYNKRTPERPCDTMVIFFSDHRPFVFALKNFPPKITLCGDDRIQILKRDAKSI